MEIESHEQPLEAPVADSEPGLSAWVEIDLSAIAHNVAAMRRVVGPGVRLYVVVKANAYGHGIVSVARAALAAGADALAVARVEEGLALRRAGIEAPVLVMNYCSRAESAAAVKASLAVTVHSMRLLQDLAAAADAAGRKAMVQVKVDTGLGRFGLSEAAGQELIRAAQALATVELEGVYSHLACAEEEAPAFSLEQFRRFQRFLTTAVGRPLPLRHLCNTAATLRWPEMHLDAVRVGLGAYGHYPAPFLADLVELRPALSLKARVARVFDLAPGESVGYGREFVAQAPTRAALVPLGYGDGLPRLLSSRGQALVRGVRVPILGRLSMDQVVVDAGAAGVAVQEGDEVVCIGRQGGEAVTVEEVAHWAGTVNYEILTGIGGRLPRVYLQGSAPAPIEAERQPTQQIPLSPR